MRMWSRYGGRFKTEINPAVFPNIREYNIPPAEWDGSPGISHADSVRQLGSSRAGGPELS